MSSVRAWPMAPALISGTGIVPPPPPAQATPAEAARTRAEAEANNTGRPTGRAARRNQDRSIRSCTEVPIRYPFAAVPIPVR